MLYIILMLISHFVVFADDLLLLLLLLICLSLVRLCATPQTAALEAPPSLDSPGKNTGVGCHFLLQCMKVKSESEVAQLCPTLSDPMDCSLPGSPVHGIFQGNSTGAGCNCLLRMTYYLLFIFILDQGNDVRQKANFE